MLQKKDRKNIVKLLNSDCCTFQNRMLEMILFSSQQKRGAIYSEIQSNTFLKSKFMNSLYRGSFSRFDKIRYCYNPELSDKEAIEVACDLIGLFSLKVEAYVALRKKYERYFLSGAYEKAIEVLNRIDAEIGVSLWSCGQRFLVRQLGQGLEGNKRELSNLSELVPHNFLVQAVLFFYSIMAETDISYENYQTEASRFLNGTESTLVGRYLTNKINFDAMLQYQDIALVMQIDCQCSIIDAYNSVEKYLPVCYKDEICTGNLEPSLYAFGIALSNLFNNLTTINAEKQEPLFLQADEHRNVYSIIENYTIGNYGEVLKLAENYLPLHPTDLQIATLFCKALILSNSPFPDTIQIEYMKHVYSIYSMDTNFRDAVLSLKQEAKRTHGLALGHKLFAFLIRKNLLAGKEVAIFVSSILDSVIHPNFARYLQGKTLHKLGQRLNTLCPCSVFLAIAGQTGRFDSLNLQNVDKNRRTLARAQYLCKNKQFDDAYVSVMELSKFILNSDAYVNERISKVLLEIYTGKSNHNLALKLLVETYFSNEFLFERLNNSGIYTVPKRIRDRAIQKELYYTIYIFLVDRGNIKQQLVGYNNYLDQNGFSNIIDALSILDDQKNAAIGKFFFENVCTIGLLKRDATLRMLSISPEEARIHILSRLMEFAPSKKCSSELNAILTAETIKENLNTINKSRINVDTDKILLTHREQWEELYRKYLTLAAFEPLIIDFDLCEHSITETDTVNLQRTLSKRTTQEKVVFNNIVKQIEDECLFSVQYGLETYLSSRIRHGYCKGQLTNFLREHHLLSMRRNEDSDEYFLNDHWDSRISPYSPIREEINEILSMFTRSIENKIDEILKSWLRIRQGKQVEGMFDFTSFVPLCEMVFADEHIQDFTVFYNRIIDAFWEYTELILEKVRARINEELTDFYITAIDQMESSLQKISNMPPAVNELLTNCKIAKARVVSAMKQFAEVFSVNNAPYNNFTMSDLIASCRRAVEKAHSESSRAKWTIEADTQHEFRGKFFAPFVDILCILLNNAIEHSGIEKIEQLQICISILELDVQEVEVYRELQRFGDAKQVFELKVTNTLDAALPRDALKVKLEKAFAKIDKGADAQKLIQGEGGSGLYKLYNTAQYNIEASYLIRYEISDNFVSFSYCFVADKLICEERADEDFVG